MTSKDLVYVILAIIIIAIVLAGVWVIVGNVTVNNYIKKNRKALIQKYAPKTTECIMCWKSVLENNANYSLYINRLGLNKVHKCSGSVVNNASNDPIKYLIKYSNLDSSLETLAMLDYCIDYRNKLAHIKSCIDSLNSESKDLPFMVRLFASDEKFFLDVCEIDHVFWKMVAPNFTFLYVSPKGRSTSSYVVTVNVQTLRAIRDSLGGKMNKSEFVKSQRSAMTNDLREAVKKRDNYTCQLCGNSVFKEPNLLLEVDHIIPVSKGGRTEANNLQTLCWRCNRAKSNN